MQIRTNEYVLARSPLPGDIRVARDGLCLLGCPIGPPSYSEDVLMTRVNKIRESQARLQDLGDSHIATTLLRFCLPLPKLSHVLHTSPPSYIQHATMAFDISM